MVITITMKNVDLRNGIYHFRLAVPKDCQKAVGRTEVTQSLKTSDPAKAAVDAKALSTSWKKRFKEIRQPQQTATVNSGSVVDEEITKLRAQIDIHLSTKLPGHLANQTEEELKQSSEWCREALAGVAKFTDLGLDLTCELGITWPLPGKRSPGMTRRLGKVVIDALAKVRHIIDEEAGRAISDEVDAVLLEPVPKYTPELQNAKVPASNATDEDTSLDKVVELMLDAKDSREKHRDLINAEIKCLQEWTGGKADITQYTKADLVDYARNCLPHLPKNMRKSDTLKSKPLRECVKLTKSGTYTQISHRTCNNRLASLVTVFNYAKDQIGIITVNPAKGVTVPKVRVEPKKERGFTNDELETLWEELSSVKKTQAKRPERYWAPVLGLYHGFRLNEICSLHVKDIYADNDGVYVIDVNDSEANKRIKTDSSERIVPIHPFVLDTLNFKDFVESKKKSSKDTDLLFPNLTFSTHQGYGRKMTQWFNKWKTEWIPEKSKHKNFHDLRYTFSQQAQNQAKMPDRYAQEITGHSISGVSAVHLGYSGHLKPKDMLTELKKVQYGWEDTH